MSVSLGIYKGQPFDCSKSELIDVIPVSFQGVWNGLWQNAIKDCEIRIFILGSDFTVNQIPEVLTEIDKVYDWVQTNGGNDKEYISKRICNELTPFLTNFYREHKDENYWFDLG